MPRRSWTLLAVFVAWTAFVWVNRITNAWGPSSTESTSSKVFATVLSGVILAVALAALVVLVRTWRSPLSVVGARCFQVLAAGTTLVWAVKVPQILLGSWSIGFKAVHTVLGAISIGLAVAVWRRVAPVAARPPSVPTADAVGARSEP